MGRNRARRVGIATVLAVALAVPTLGTAGADEHHGSDHGSGDFRVGAAAVDVTPPAAGPGVADPAHCVAPAGYDGAHLLTLEEPYQDVNGNGRYDDGEPFQDCPVARVDGTTAPPDTRWDGIYLGGGDCCDRKPTAVLDPIWARTIVVGNGDRTVSITSVDNEGVFKEYWDRVRAKVRADGVHLDQMFFSSTHDESAPDTIGITGPNELTSGVDPFYVEFLIARTAQSIEQAAGRTRRASIRYGSVRPLDLTTCWSSYPFAADESIGAMQAVGTNGHVIATLVNYGIHAEELGFSDDAQDRLHLSSDWPNFTRQKLEAYYGGMAMTMAGSVGSVEMPQVYPANRDHTPTNLYSSTGNGGCRTIYTNDATRAPYGYHASTQARGETIARWAVWALATGRWSRSDTIRFRRDTFFMPLENALFALGGAFGVIPGKDGYLDGVKLTRNAAGAVDPIVVANEFQTEVAWYRIGDADFVSAPGELFPFTYARDFGGPADQAVPDGGSPPPWIMARLSQRYRFVEGLGEDMVGYLFPKTNAVGVPRTLDGADDTDRFGCGHSDDGEAAADDAGGIAATHLAALLPTTKDWTVTGRYVWVDGTQHRSPLGEGGQACTGPGNTFVPGPGARGVAFGGHTITVDGREWRWMDLHGQAEAAPSTQTRGVISRDGQRVFLDVFPDA
ncbi:MAG: hypothetical protein ACXVLO_19180 [Acidimicrobiia bacterium]